MVQVDKTVAGRKRKAEGEHEEAPSSKRRRVEAGGPSNGPTNFLPTELTEKTAKFLHSKDPIATRDDQTNLQLVNSMIRNAIAGAPIKEGNGAVDGGSSGLKKFNSRIRRLGTLAVRTMKDVVPADSLPDDASGGEPRLSLPDEASGGEPRDSRRNDPLTAHDIVDTVGPILHFQDKAALTKLVNSVGGFEINSSVAIGEVLYAFAKHSERLSAEHHETLGSRAIEVLAQYVPPISVVEQEAAKALVVLESHGHLNEDRKKALEETLDVDANLAELLEQARRDVKEERVGLSIAEPGASGDLSKDQVSLDVRIGQLEQMDSDAGGAVEMNRHEVLDHREKIAREIPNLYSRARDELVRSLRDNDRVR